MNATTPTTPTEPLWGIGCYDDGTGRASWRISHDEIGRDIGVAIKVLGEFGVAGGGVLWCSMLSQAGQFWPYICGTVMAGARLSCADATAGEAARVAMFLRLMTYDAVFGITDAILDGLDELEQPYGDVFAGVRILGAGPGAYERVEAAGCTPTRFVCCGPTIAIGREPSGPAFVPETEWALTTNGDDRVCVTNLQPRAQQFERTPVGVRGQIVDAGIVPTP
jgi:hypothetical protein